MKKFFVLVSCIGLFSLVHTTNAQDAPADADQSTTAQSVAELIDQLNDDRFVQREKATQTLAKLGQKAVPALGKAAADERPEVSERAFKALSSIMKKGDAESQAAAKSKLGELAKSENQSVAKGAQSILEKPAESAADRAPRRPFGIFGRAGRIEIAPGGIGGGRIARRIRIARGVDGGSSEIEATEGDRTVKITENATDGINVQVTETKDGKEITKEYKAASEKELKEKHPAGHKIYQQYSGDGRARIGRDGLGGIRLEFGGGIGGGGIDGGGIGGALPEEMRKRIGDELRKALEEGALPPGIIPVPGGALPPGIFPDGALPEGDLGEELKKAEAELRKMIEDGGLPGAVPPEFKKMIERFEKRAAPRETDRDTDRAADAPAADREDLDASIERLRKSLKGTKDEKKMLAALKQLEKLQAEQLERLKAKQAEIEAKLKEAE